jgi:hypothetical protein
VIGVPVHLHDLGRAPDLWMLVASDHFNQNLERLHVEPTSFESVPGFEKPIQMANRLADAISHKLKVFCPAGLLQMSCRSFSEKPSFFASK